MPSRGLRGLWLRSAAAVAACLLALSSTGALVAAAVVAPGSAPAIALTDEGSGGGGGSSNDTGGNGHGVSNGTNPSQPEWLAAVLAKLKAEQDKNKQKSTPTPPLVHRPASHPAGAGPAATSSHHAQGPATRAAPVPTEKVVVDTSDPAPFSAQAVSAIEAARVLPVERLGPLSGVSFGSGLFIWPLLLAVDVFALAVIARMALRRRLAPPED